MKFRHPTWHPAPPQNNNKRLAILFSSKLICDCVDFFKIDMQSNSAINSLNKSLTSELNDGAFKDFVARIQTFIDEQKWIKKPLSLSPSICAQYGWKCVKTDLLECVTCGAKLCARGSKIENFEAYKACIKKTVADLKDSHGKHCPWPLTPAPENFVRMVLMPKEEALSQFLKCVKSSVCFQALLPKIRESALDDLGLNEQHILSLCKLAGIKTEDASLFGKSLIPLSATGWIIVKDEDSEKSVLKCKNCLRSVWCGSFCLLRSENSAIKENETSDLDSNILSSVSENGNHEVSGEKQPNSEEPPTKKKRISFVIKKGEPFDPLHEHRPWCMWIHDGTDSYTSTSCDKEPVSNVPGWKIFVKSLLRNVSECQNLEINDSPSREQIKNVRSLLEKWTDAVV